MPIRRAADPICVQHVWDAIKSSISQRQTPDSKRIIKYLQRVDKSTLTQAELHINQALQDGFIVTLHKTPPKGESSCSFKITTQELPDLDGSDWYCFECHLGGNVSACRQCFRVFHVECINSSRHRFEEYKKTNNGPPVANPRPPQQTEIAPMEVTTDQPPANNSINISSDSDKSTYDNKENSFNNNEANNGNSSAIVGGQEDQQPSSSGNGGDFDESLCSMCNIAAVGDSATLDKAELNYLLKFVIHRIQSWLPNLITHTMATEERPEWLTDKELTWRANQLFFEHKDMSVIEVNLNNEFYSHIHEFFADVLAIQHNVAIFHGIESQEYGAADLMVRDCIHDLTEMKICVDCYRHSNEKINSKWFCLPCRVPHQLVWAKQKGYPYWPAKVIRETDSQYDVRFFGGKYERSLLLKLYIKPIETPKEKLQIKSSGAFNKAVDELKYHQKLMTNPAELQKLIESSKTRVRSMSKPKITPVRTPKTSTSSNRNSMTRNHADSRKSSCDSNDVYRFEDLPFSESTPLPLGGFKKRKSSLTDCVTTPNKRKLDSVEKLSNASHHSKGADHVIDISDGDDEHTEFSFRQKYSLDSADYNNGSLDQVSSSTENCKSQSDIRVSQNNGIQSLDRPYSDSVERMRRTLESLSEKQEIIKCAMECMQGELDSITNDHDETLKRLFESHNSQISETKKKQWCYNCEQEAIYHCCWNTAYCSTPCQQQHWQSEHKKVCRRKR